MCRVRSPPGERRVYWNISSPVKGFRAIQKPLYSPPLLTSIFLPTNIFSISLHQTLHLFTQVSIPKRERVWAPLPDVVLESLGRRLCRMCLKYPPLCYCRSELSKTSLLAPFYSVYRLLCYLPSLNSFHKILFVGSGKPTQWLLKPSLFPSPFL